MSDFNEQHEIGRVIGDEAADHAERCATNYCTSERLRIETVNQPKIDALRATIALLQDVAEAIEKRIRHAPPAGDEHARRGRARFYWAMAALLIVAGFVFSILAFEPYRLGWKAWLYCAGIAAVTPFLTEAVLDRWKSEKLLNVLVTVAFLASITSLVFLAVIRGDLLTQQITSASPVVIVGGETPAAPPPSTFYERTLDLLRLVMAFLAVAIELGAGYALYQAKRWSAPVEDAGVLRQKLGALREEMIIHGHAMRSLQNEGVAFEYAFWREFSRALLNGVKRGAIRKLLLLTLCLGLLMHGRAYAADRLDLIILPDLSQSVDVKDQDNRAEFGKNVESVTRILATLPAGAKVTVLGITDDSFARPYIIFSGELTEDEGYFKERLATGRAALTRAWVDRSARLAPRFAQTDILGALLVASELFHESPNGRRKVLVILSDMRQATGALNLEHQAVVETSAALRQVTKKKLLADLHGVDVYALGVDAAGTSVGYWQSLRNFWTAYFEQAGANVKGYSLLRELPELGR
jgi:hypothetical protein